jgi:hypothetical protein
MGTVKIKHPITYTGEGSLHSSYGPFNSIAEALNEPSTRFKGLTLGVIEDGSVVEYWWKDGVEDGDLILKSTGGGSATGFEINFLLMGA